MKKNYKVLSFISCFILLFNSFTIPVCASGKDFVGITGGNITALIASVSGVVFGNPSGAWEVFTDVLKRNNNADGNLDKWINGDYSDDISVADNGDIHISVELQNVLKETANELKNTQPYYYVYSLDFNSIYYTFNSGVMYNKLKNIIRNNPNSFVVFSGQYWGGLYISDASDNSFVFHSYNSSTRTRNVEIYNNTSWQNVKSTKYEWSKSSEDFVHMSDNVTAIFALSDYPTWYKYDNYNWDCLVTDGVKCFICYKTVNDLKGASVGNLPYYEIDVSKLQPLNTNNINSYSNAYSAITNDSSIKDSNNQYSYDYSQVTNIVNNYVTNNYDSGGDSGNGSGSGSGSGSGDGGGSNIFDWLGDLGDVLGNLIKNAGALLTDLLEAFVSIFSDLTTVVPDTVSTAFGSYLSWIPPEIWVLVRLALVLGLVGILVRKFLG